MSKPNRACPKKIAVLDFIRKGGERGRSFTEVQEFVCRMNGLDWNEMAVAWAPDRFNETTAAGFRVKVPSTTFRTRKVRRYRGYWCSYLLNEAGWQGSSRRHGILPRYCRRNGLGRWVYDHDKGPIPTEGF